MSHRSTSESRARPGRAAAPPLARRARRCRVTALAAAACATCLLASGCGDDGGRNADPTGGGTPDVAATDVESGIEAAESWLASGRPELAEPIARRLVLLRPESAVARELLARSLALGAANAGDERIALERRAEALAAYDAAVDLERDAAVRAGLLHAAGIVAEATGETDRAIAFYERARTDAPDDFRHPLFLGNALLRVDRVSDAGEPLFAARALDPEQPWTHAAIAEHARRLERHEDALRSIERALELAPGANAFRVARARILRGAGRPGDAARSLAALGEDALIDAGVLTEYAAALDALGEHAVAARAWERRLAAHADDRAAALAAASAWERAGDPVRARAWRDRAELIEAADDAPVRGGPIPGG